MDGRKQDNKTSSSSSSSSWFDKHHNDDDEYGRNKSTNQDDNSSSNDDEVHLENTCSTSSETTTTAAAAGVAARGVSTSISCWQGSNSNTSNSNSIEMNTLNPNNTLSYYGVARLSPPPPPPMSKYDEHHNHNNEKNNETRTTKAMTTTGDRVISNNNNNTPHDGGNCTTIRQGRKSTVDGDVITCKEEEEKVDALCSHTPVDLVSVVEEDELEREFHSRLSDLARRQSVVSLSFATETIDIEAVEQEKRKRFIIKVCLTVGTVILFCLIIGLLLLWNIKNNNSNEQDVEIRLVTLSPSTAPSLVPTKAPSSTIDTILQRQYLNCGTIKNRIGFHEVSNTTITKQPTGFHVDLCRAIAAALFRNTNDDDDRHVRFIDLPKATGSLNSLAANESIDLVARGITYTMERDVYLESSGVGFSFTVPYMYDGLAFAGIPEYVACADSLLAHDGICSKLKICVCSGCTHKDILERDFFPSDRLFPTIDRYQSFANGYCNVIAGERNQISPKVFQSKVPNYDGTYETGRNLFSKEPLALVTRDDDHEWSEFCNMILQSLISAETYNITKDNYAAADTTALLKTKLFGERFEDMFVNAIQAVGNYGEIYARNLQELVPRQGLDYINTRGDTGLIYSFPFGGGVSNVGPAPMENRTLDAIVKREHLMCGIHNATNQVWNGMSLDFCQAVSAGIFNGSLAAAGGVELVEFHDIEDGFAALLNGTLDVLSGATITVEASVTGISFSPPYFYIGDRSGDSSSSIAMATRYSDSEWSSFVYWVVSSTFYAEENRIDSDASNSMPEVNLFGTNFSSMFQDIIESVGNYGQIYERNVETLYPRNGTRNMLNQIPFGPQHFPLSPFELGGE